MKLLNKILFFVLMGLLFIPMVQQFTHFSNVIKLNGYVKNTEFPALNSDSWFGETFQLKVEKNLSQKFGFANSFIRLQNQIQFSLFKVAKANGVIIGKDDYLYEKSYIDAYFGNDFLGKKTLEEQFSKLQTLKDSLNNNGVELLLVYAPGKGSFYPEFIPDKLITEKKITNLEYSLRITDSLKLDHINMSSWFIHMKDTSQFCLYPKTGIHYSFYGARLALDTIVNYCKLKYKFDLPEVNWSEIELSNKLKDTDRDIERGMNIIQKLDNFAMPYQNIKVSKQSKNTPKLIVIADSYYWQLHNMGMSKNVFQEGQFWFYNNQIYGNKDEKKVENLNLKKELLEQNLILLLCTEPVLKRQYWEFIDKAYDAFINPQQIDFNNEIEDQVAKIKQNKSLLESIKVKAQKRNIPLDSMIMLDAEYIIQQKHKTLK